MTYYRNVILTTEGFKDSLNISVKDNTFDREGKPSSITKVTTSKVFPTHFTSITTTTCNVPSLIRNDKKIYSIDNVSFTPLYIQAVDLVVDNWVYYPWVKREPIAAKTTIDLTPFIDTHYDTDIIYLFNNEILSISTKLGLQQHIVKELLIREAAEYEEYLPTLRNYIENTYGIKEDPSSEVAFQNFKKFIVENHVFKMKRYIRIDEDFICFLIAILTHCKPNVFAFNKNNYYSLRINVESFSKSFIKRIEKFLSKMKVKFSVSSKDINITNKPLYKFVTEGILTNVDFIFRFETEMLDYFLEQLCTNCNKVYAELNVLFQLKLALSSRKTVLGILDKPDGGYVGKIYKKDSLDTLEDTLILTENGYYSKIDTLTNVVLKDQYKYISSERAEVLYSNILVKE